MKNLANITSYIRYAFFKVWDHSWCQGVILGTVEHRKLSKYLVKMNMVLTKNSGLTKN